MGSGWLIRIGESFEWTACIGAPFLRVHSLGGNFVFSRRSRQSNWLDRGW